MIEVTRDRDLYFTGTPLREIRDAMAPRMEGAGSRRHFIGYGIDGALLAACCGFIFERDVYLYRDTPKDYGTRKIIEGPCDNVACDEMIACIGEGSSCGGDDLDRSERFSFRPLSGPVSGYLAGGDGKPVPAGHADGRWVDVDEKLISGRIETRRGRFILSSRKASGLYVDVVPATTCYRSMREIARYFSNFSIGDVVVGPSYAGIVPAAFVGLHMNRKIVIPRIPPGYEFAVPDVDLGGMTCTIVDDFSSNGILLKKISDLFGRMGMRTESFLLVVNGNRKSTINGAPVVSLFDVDGEGLRPGARFRERSGR